MRVTITIKCDNEAFEPYAGTEIARILTELAEDMRDDVPMDRSLLDRNGNRVGRVEVSE